MRKTKQINWNKIVNDLETRHDIQEYLAYLKLPYTEQAQIKASWEEYYQKARQSRAYERLMEMKSALRSGDRDRVLGLREECKIDIQNNSFNGQPKHRDPSEYYRGVFERYRHAKKMLDQTDEYAGVESIFQK